MKNHGKSFTFDVDLLLLDQIEARSIVTGRSRSREMSYLVSLAFRELDAGATEVFSQVGAKKRVCIYLSPDVYLRAEQHSQENHRAMGSTLNVMLRTALDASARRNASMSDGGPKDPGEQSPEQTASAASPI